MLAHAQGNQVALSLAGGVGRHHADVLPVLEARVVLFYDDVAVRERHTQTVVARHQAVKAVDAVLARRRGLQFAALFVQQDNLRAGQGRNLARVVAPDHAADACVNLQAQHRSSIVVVFANFNLGHDELTALGGEGAVAQTRRLRTFLEVVGKAVHAGGNAVDGEPPIRIGLHLRKHRAGFIQQGQRLVFRGDFARVHVPVVILIHPNLTGHLRRNHAAKRLIQPFLAQPDFDVHLLLVQPVRQRQGHIAVQLGEHHALREAQGQRVSVRPQPGEAVRARRIGEDGLLRQILAGGGQNQRHAGKRRFVCILRAVAVVIGKHHAFNVAQSQCAAQGRGDFFAHADGKGIRRAVGIRRDGVAAIRQGSKHAVARQLVAQAVRSGQHRVKQEAAIRADGAGCHVAGFVHQVDHRAEQAAFIRVAQAIVVLVGKHHAGHMAGGNHADIKARQIRAHCQRHRFAFARAAGEVAEDIAVARARERQAAVRGRAHGVLPRRKVIEGIHAAAVRFRRAGIAVFIRQGDGEVVDHLFRVHPAAGEVVIQIHRAGDAAVSNRADGHRHLAVILQHHVGNRVLAAVSAGREQVAVLAIARNGVHIALRNRRFDAERAAADVGEGEAPVLVGDGVQQLLADGLTVQDDLHAFQRLFALVVHAVVVFIQEADAVDVRALHHAKEDFLQVTAFKNHLIRFRALEFAGDDGAAITARLAVARKHQAVRQAVFDIVCAVAHLTDVEFAVLAALGFVHQTVFHADGADFDARLTGFAVLIHAVVVFIQPHKALQRRHRHHADAHVGHRTGFEGQRHAALHLFGRFIHDGHVCADIFAVRAMAEARGQLAAQDVRPRRHSQRHFAVLVRFAGCHNNLHAVDFGDEAHRRAGHAFLVFPA